MPLTEATIGAIGGVAQAGLTMIGQKAREKRALENQKDLMDIQQKNQMALNKQGQSLQMQTWEDTNYPAQMKMMKEAGLSTGLMYGQGGGGGTTTGSQSGGSAASGSAPAPQPMELGSAIQSAMQLALMKSQKENIDADTKAKLTGEAYQGGAQTDNTNAQTNKLKEEKEKTFQEGRSQYLDNMIKEYGMEDSENEINNVRKSRYYGEGQVHDKSAIAQTINTNVEKLKTELEGAKITNNIKDAEKIIKNFEAQMAKEGISTNSPYYIKLLTDILRKTGVLNWIKEK